MNFCGQCGFALVPSVDTPNINITTSADFVGRQHEISELVSALDDAQSGQGRLVMLVGEPGIGKTRTAEEFAAYAQKHGSLVLWGRCHEQQGMPPFWPWIQAIRSYVRGREPGQLRSDMGAGASIIAEIVPDVNEVLTDLKPSPELESPEQARFRLFDAITTFLKHVSLQSNALTLILDDLHWADKPSLLLLEFLSQELSDSRLMVIGTYRNVDLSRQHPLAETLGELTRARLFQRVVLRGLSLEDEEQLIQATSGVQPDQEFVELIHSRTEGNPLFIGEVIRMLEQEGGYTPDSTVNRIPEGEREVIGRRLNRLTDQCNQALTVASVIGREFEFTQLVRLVEGVSEDDLLESLEEALSASVIEEVPDSLGRYQFTHALIQQTLMDELSTTRRVRLSVRIIKVFEELYAADLGSQATELAYHAGEAEAIIGPEKLLHYSIIAGERDLESYSFEDAHAHFQRALGAREDETMDDQLATIKFGIGRAMAQIVRSSDDAQLGWAAMSETFEYYVEQGDIEKAVNVAIHPSPVLYLIKGAAELLARAIELVPRDSLQAAYLLSKRASALLFESADFEGSRKAAMEAITIARREHDEVLEAQSLAYLVNSLRFDHRPWEAIEAGFNAIEISQRIGDLQSEQRAQVFSAQELWTVGEPDRARVHADAVYQAAEKLHERTFQVMGLMISADCAAFQGDWSNANELADQVLEIVPQNVESLGLKAWISLQSNDVEPTKHLVDNLSGGSSRAMFVNAWLTRTAYEKNDNEYMKMWEATLKVMESSANALEHFWIRRCAVITAVLRRDPTAAAEHYSTLVLDKGTILFPALFSVDHILGLLAQTMGKLDDAPTHFEDAIAFCRKANYRPEMAWTCHDYADMLLERDEPGDQQKAIELVNESDQIASDLSMKPLKGRTAALRERLEARSLPKPEYPDGLTKREVDVLRLIAQGKGNPEIAEELVVSIRTVTTHVTNIFGKINAANRVEAALYATSHGLT